MIGLSIRTMSYITGWDLFIVNIVRNQESSPICWYCMVTLPKIEPVKSSVFP